MAKKGKKISELPKVSNIDLQDVFPLVQDSTKVTKSVKFEDIKKEVFDNLGSATSMQEDIDSRIKKTSITDSLDIKDNTLVSSALAINKLEEKKVDKEDNFELISKDNITKLENIEIEANKTIISDSFTENSKTIAASTYLTNDLEDRKVDRSELSSETIYNKGLFDTLDNLKLTYPEANNKKEWYAFVGSQNPRKKYIVKVDGGDWIDTGETHTVNDVNMTEYAKKTREDGFKVVYTIDGKTGIEDAVETNWSIPFGKGNRKATNWIFLYENSSSLVGKKIDTLKFDVQKIGVTTLVVAIGAPNALTIKQEININLTQLGEFTIRLDQPLEILPGEFVGFNTIKKTGMFRVNDTRKNSVAGGYYYYAEGSTQGTLSPRDLCVGFGVNTGKSPIAYRDDIVTVSGSAHLGEFTSKEIARNSVDLKFRKKGLIITYSIQGVTHREIFNGTIDKWTDPLNWSLFIKGEYRPIEIIPFKGNGLTESRYLFFYENQTPIRGKEIDRIRINAKQAGTLGIYVCTNIEVGKSRVDISSFTLQIPKEGVQILNFPEPIILKDDEWLGIGYGTAGFMVDLDSNNDIGKGYYYCNNISKEVIALFQGRNLCVGVIEKGAKENLTIDGLAIKDEENTKKEGSVLEMNKHKIGDIYSLGKTVTSRLAPTKKTRLLTFMHLTDIHLNWKGLARALEFMNNDVPNGCDFAVNSGDTVINWDDDMTDYIKQVNSSRKNIYHCLGNHDVKSADYEVHYKKFFEPMEQKLEYGNGRNLYYYKDLKGVRFIFLHDFDNGSWATSYGQAQIDWFINALKGCEYAIIVKHHPVYQIHGKNIIDSKGKPIEWYNDFFDYNTPTIAPTTYGENSGDPIIEIVEAWRNGTSLTRTYYEVVVNVEFEQKGQFITYLCGHEHYDKFGYVGNTTQLMIVNNCTSMMDVYGDMPRIANTITQDVINYMNVSLDEKTLTVLRLGSDCSYTGRDRKKICVTWDKDKMINS